MYSKIKKSQKNTDKVRNLLSQKEVYAKFRVICYQVYKLKEETFTRDSGVRR